MESWFTRLRDGGADRELAITEMRDFLLRALQGRFSGRAGGDHAMLEDIVQDSLVKILSRLESFEGRGRFTSWILSITIRIAYNELRRRDWGQVSIEDLRAESRSSAEPSDPSPEPNEEADRRDVIRTMRRVIDSQLTTKQRDVLLCELNGMPQEEIARQLNTNRNNVYKLFHDARKALKRALAAEGFGENSLLGHE